jgi:acyl-CoA reductase-like NAD-dependent aldehyde dehydrogenase
MKLAATTREERLLIDGRLVAASDEGCFENVNPATEAVIGVTADATGADMDRAIGAARRAFDETSWAGDPELGGKSALLALDDADLTTVAGNSAYGLSGMVVSSSAERARRVAERVRTGTISVNGGLYYGADAPFGGYRQSGVGRESGLAGFEEYLEIKTIALGLT